MLNEPIFLYAFGGLVVAYLAYMKLGAVWQRAKAVMFTPEAVIASLVHYAVIVATLATWMFVQVRVLGNPVQLTMGPEYEDEEQEAPPPKKVARR